MILRGHSLKKQRCNLRSNVRNLHVFKGGNRAKVVLSKFFRITTTQSRWTQLESEWNTRKEKIIWSDNFTRLFLSLPYLIRFVKSANNRCNFFSNLWCKLPCFCNCDSKEKCVQIFVPCKVALFLQDGSQVFGRACFQQPYYGKLFFKLVVQVTVFFQLRFKRKVRANFCALQRCTFPTRVFTSFWTCLLSATVLRQTLLRNLLPVAKNMKLHEKNRKKISQTVDSFWRLIYNVKAVEVRV